MHAPGVGVELTGEAFDVDAVAARPDLSQAPGAQKLYHLVFVTVPRRSHHLLFTSHGSLPGRTATQAAIYAVQRQLEAVVLGEGQVAVMLCDRDAHPNRVSVPAGPAFAVKAQTALNAIGVALPGRCRQAAGPEHGGSPP